MMRLAFGIERSADVVLLPAGSARPARAPSTIPSRRTKSLRRHASTVVKRHVSTVVAHSSSSAKVLFDRWPRPRLCADHCASARAAAHD
eukprot:3485877-Pleurochrysis_carterae.AAC.3